jgi:hypothetical protein
VAVQVEARRTRFNVLEAHLDSFGDGSHAAPVRLVGIFLETIQEMADAIGQIVYDSFTARGRISDAVLQRTQLMALATKPGSFAISMSAGTPGTLFPDADTNPVLEKLSGLLQAQDEPEELHRSLLSLKSRTAAKYRRMLEALVAEDAGLRLYWGSPMRETTTLSLSRSQARAALQIVKSVEREMAEALDVVGVLKAIDITASRKFKLLDDRGNELSGAVLDDAMPSAEHATINLQYRARMRIVREVSSSGAVRELHYLENLTPSDAEPDPAV